MEERRGPLDQFGDNSQFGTGVVTHSGDKNLDQTATLDAHTNASSDEESKDQFNLLGSESDHGVGSDDMLNPGVLSGAESLVTADLEHQAKMRLAADDDADFSYKAPLDDTGTSDLSVYGIVEGRSIDIEGAEEFAAHDNHILDTSDSKTSENRSD